MSNVLLDIDWGKAKKYLTKYDLEDIRDRNRCSIETLEVLDRVYRKL